MRPLAMLARILGLVVFMLGFATLILPNVLHAEATTILKTTTTVPLNTVQFNQCTGENVALSGMLRTRIDIMMDGHGGFHSRLFITPEDVRGVGQVSGTEYLEVGGTRNITNNTSGGTREFTATSMLNFISKGSAPNLQTKYTIHFTINPNGDLTANVSNFSTECHG